MTTLPRPFFARPILLLAALAGALLLSLAPPARARPPSDDEPAALAPRVERLDAAPHELWTPEGARAHRPPLWVAIHAGFANLAGGERAFTGMLLASIPLERFAGGPAPRAGRPALAEGAAPRSEPAPPPASPEPAEPSPPLPVRVTPDVARAAVRAALHHARLTDPEARIDSLATRARTSSLLPELRLRVARQVDEQQNLSPTEYDPSRITAAGGASLWLEARATWRLDRLVFADEEVALERLRRERAEAQSKLVKRVLDLLFAWQRALAREADAAKSPEDRLAATLDLVEIEASLDLVTDGWFTRWRKAQAGP
jgi:hypothetical protein